MVALIMDNILFDHVFQKNRILRDQQHLLDCLDKLILMKMCEFEGSSLKF